MRCSFLLAATASFLLSACTVRVEHKATTGIRCNCTRVLLGVVCECVPTPAPRCRR